MATPQGDSDLFSSYPVTDFLRGKLTEIFDRVGIKRETVFVTRRGKVIAKIIPIAKEEAKVISDMYAAMVKEHPSGPNEVKR